MTNEMATCDRCDAPLTAEEIEVQQWQFETEVSAISVATDGKCCELCSAQAAKMAAEAWLRALEDEEDDDTGAPA